VIGPWECLYCVPIGTAATCEYVFEEGFYCTRAEGHEGPHVACGNTHHAVAMIAEWRGIGWCVGAALGDTTMTVWYWCVCKTDQDGCQEMVEQPDTLCEFCQEDCEQPVAAAPSETP
jgi:hypothetical protein